MSTKKPKPYAVAIFGVEVGVYDSLEIAKVEYLKQKDRWIDEAQGESPKTSYKQLNEKFETDCLIYPAKKKK